MENHGTLKIKRIILAIILALIVNSIQLPISDKEHAVLVITVFSGFMWFTEALPLHVTALLVTVLLVLFSGTTPKEAFLPFFDPVIVLFFGGFVIARAMQKHGLDKQIAKAFIAKVGAEPKKFLLGLFAATAFLSLWISNTAATAIMLPIVIFAVTRSKLVPLKSNFAKAAALGIAFASTIGGIGLVVGTPPNGLVVSNLARVGIQVSFLDWAFYGFPFVVVFLPITWFILISIFPPEIKSLKTDHVGKGRWTKEHKMVLFVGALTILAWVTSGTHHVHDSIVAIGSVIFLYALGLLETQDISKIEWPALLLFGGGLSLGVAIESSGLGATLGGLLGSMIVGQVPFVIFIIVMAFVVMMTLSASNTATAGMVIPLVIPLAKAANVSIKQLAIIAGIGTSLDFLFPIGTPPSAIAYSTGYITTGDMLKAGLVVTVAGILLLAAMATLYW